MSSETLPKCEKCDGHGVIEDWYYLHSEKGAIYHRWKDIMQCPQCTKEEERLLPLYNPKMKWRITNGY